MGKAKTKEYAQGSVAGNLAKVLVVGIALVVLSLVYQHFIAEKDTSALAIVSPICFSEVMTANTSAFADDYGNSSDWFEITNTGERSIDLTGWFVIRGTESRDIYTFGKQIIKPDEHAVVFASGKSQNNPSYVCHAPFGLTAAGETLTLLDASGNIIDTIETPPLARNQVYALIDGAWTNSMLYTPGMANTAENHAALISETALAEGNLVISEVMNKNVSTIRDIDGDYSDYIELHNVSGRAVNAKGFMLSDNDTALGKYVLPDATIEAGGYLLVFASGKSNVSGELHAPFSLSAGESVYLSDPSGHVISSTTPATDSADQAWSLLETRWSAFLPPTPGQPNNEAGVGVIDNAITTANTSGLFISEIMASTNDTSVSSASYDWFEIYNATAGTLDLSGWGVSDNSNHPRKWQFPSGATIASGQYMVIFCSGKDTKSGGSYHTNFSLSSAGGYSITLCDPSGVIVDRMAVNQQYTNISYGRAYGMSGLRYFLEPTPGAANSTYGYTARAQQAVCSINGGLFGAGETISVSLSAPSGSSIYYTTDCSDPDNTSTLYTGPITLNSTTILRTIVYSDNKIPSLIDTQSYFFGVSHTMRVVSLVTDPANLWDYNTGIYVMGPNAWSEAPYGANNQGANFWMDWEKAGNVELFATDGSTILSQGCGVKLQGQYSRDRDQKAFKLYARTLYDTSNRFEAALFDARDYTEYQSFVLRASGQDGGKTRIRDVLQTSLAEGTDIMYQAAEMCIVYLNGEYWGHYNMRERISKFSISQWQGWTGDPDDIDITKGNRTVMQGSNDTYANLLDWIKNEGGATARKNETLTQADYDSILEYIGSIVDVDEYLDYVAIEMYTGNTDLLNVKRYRSDEGDGLWHWVLYDMDWGFYYLDTNTMRRWLDPAGAGSEKKTDNTLFVELMKNPQIQDKYLKRFNELMVSTFNTEAVLAKMNALYAELEPEIDQHLARWNTTRTKYDSEWATLRNIVINRPEYMLNYIQETYAFSDETMQSYFAESYALIKAYKATHG